MIFFCLPPPRFKPVLSNWSDAFPVILRSSNNSKTLTQSWDVGGGPGVCQIKFYFHSLQAAESLISLPSTLWELSSQFLGLSQGRPAMQRTDVVSVSKCGVPFHMCDYTYSRDITVGFTTATRSAYVCITYPCMFETHLLWNGLTNLAKDFFLLTLSL